MFGSDYRAIFLHDVDYKGKIGSSMNNMPISSYIFSLRLQQNKTYIVFKIVQVTRKPFVIIRVLQTNRNIGSGCRSGGGVSVALHLIIAGKSVLHLRRLLPQVHRIFWPKQNSIPNLKCYNTSIMTVRQY